MIRALDAKAATKGTVAAGGGGAATGAVNSALDPVPVPEVPAASDPSVMPDPGVSVDAIYMILSVLAFGIGAALIATIFSLLWRNCGRLFGYRVPT